MRTSAAPAWADGDLTLGPGAPPRKRFQRIFPSGWSEWLKESRTGDADDGTLIWRTRQGDAAAFEALIRQHQHMIYSLTYRMTGSLTDAEDLTQETFLRAWRQIGSYPNFLKPRTQVVDLQGSGIGSLATTGLPSKRAAWQRASANPAWPASR